MWELKEYVNHFTFPEERQNKIAFRMEAVISAEGELRLLEVLRT